MRMPREMFEERLRIAKPKLYAWERQAADGIGIPDLDEGRIWGAVRLGVEAGRISPSALTDDLTRVLSKWHLLTNDGKPNNAAAFLFGTNTNDYPQFKLRMARFVGVKKQEFIDSMTAEGNFFDLLDAGTSFFFKHLSQSGKIVGFRREERLEIPAEALREALTNSLCHRQWEKSSQTISIAIFDNRLEISNPGVLPPELPIEYLKQPHDSFPYNPVLAEVLFQTKFLEKWGTGVSRIIDVCREHGVHEPEWTSERGIVTVTFNRGNDWVERRSDRVSDRIIAILAFCMKPRSRREILAHIGLKMHSDNYNRYIKPLLESGQLELTQPDRPSSPTQRYVTKNNLPTTGTE